AEDGIRDFHVTGVQTCALPILSLVAASTALSGAVAASLGGALYQLGAGRAVLTAAAAASVAVLFILVLARRRIGGEVGRLFRGKIGRASCRERGWMGAREQSAR